MILQMTNETYLVLFFGVLALTIIFLIFLIFRVRKGHRRFKDEKSIILEGLYTRSAILSAINVYSAKSPADIFFSLIRIEVTNFDDILNAFGKQDAMFSLEKLAFHISELLPKRALMANYQTTDFLIFLKSEYDRFQCLELAKSIIGIIKKPIRIYHDTTVEFTANIGIAFHPAHGRNFSRLENSLRLALENAKKLGDNNYAVYASTTTAQSGGDVEYHYDIKKAMENKEFVLYYQPIINIASDAFYGAEALVRWHHPKHGVLTPAQFINTMEQTGDIVWIGTWGIETLTKEYLELKKQFPDNEFLFNLNLSPKQLMEETLVKEFIKIIRKYSLSPDFICLEISDFSLLEKNQIIKRNVQNLKRAGFKIAINGYGLDSGHLSSFDKIPADMIKLDRNFFNSDTTINRRIADLIIEFSRKQGMKVVAEEIENEEMFKTAEEMGIAYIQGFYFSRPILTENLFEYISEKKWSKADDGDIFTL